MRFLSLLRYQYTKRGIKELFVMLLTGFIVITLMDVLTLILYTLTVAQMAKDSLPSKTVYFYPFNRISDLIIDAEGEEEPNDALIAYLTESIENSGAQGVGKMVVSSAYGEAFDETVYVGYNQDMIRCTTLPLLRGQWSDMDSMADEIPIIVGGAYRDQKNIDLGDTLQFDLNLENGETYTCRVVGILNHEDMFFDLSYGESVPTVSSIARLNRWLDNTHKDITNYIVIYPTKPFEATCDIEYSPGQLMFFEDNARLDSLNTGERYSTYATIDNMIKAQIKKDMFMEKRRLFEKAVEEVASLTGCLGYAGGIFIVH